VKSEKEGEVKSEEVGVKSVEVRGRTVGLNNRRRGG
jgi:hypothetical protein